MRKFPLTAVVSVVVVCGAFIFIPYLSHAASFDLPNISCPSGIDCTSVSDADVAENPAAYVARLYQIALAIAGALAVAIIVVGSLFYTFAGGSTDRQREGKEMITAALWGIALLFGSYLILSTVNPELVTLDIENVAEVEPASQTFVSDDVRRQAILNCEIDAIAGRGNCQPDQANYIACLKNHRSVYTYKLKECREDFDGGGAYIYHATDPSDEAECHPYYKNFEAREFYRPSSDVSAESWAAGEWDFCPIL